MRTDKYFIEMLEILKKDKISDVRELVSQILIFLPNSNKMELEETEDIKTFFSLHNASSNDNNNNFKTIYDNK